MLRPAHCSFVASRETTLTSLLWSMDWKRSGLLSFVRMFSFLFKSVEPRECKSGATLNSAEMFASPVDVEIEETKLARSMGAVSTATSRLGWSSCRHIVDLRISEQGGQFRCLPRDSRNHYASSEFNNLIYNKQDFPSSVVSKKVCDEAINSMPVLVLLEEAT